MPRIDGTWCRSAEHTCLRISTSIFVSYRHPVHRYCLNGVNIDILIANLFVDLGYDILLLALKCLFLHKLFLWHLCFLLVFGDLRLILFVESIQLSLDLLHAVLLIGQKESSVGVNCLDSLSENVFQLIHPFF